jgi:Flp pilus assembly protein TadB
MWLARPVYEFLPYAYMLLGTVLLGASFISAAWSTLLMWLGIVALVLGLVFWLKRRDYRTAQTEYNRKSLDD